MASIFIKMLPLLTKDLSKNSIPKEPPMKPSLYIRPCLRSIDVSYFLLSLIECNVEGWDFSRKSLKFIPTIGIISQVNSVATVEN